MGNTNQFSKDYKSAKANRSVAKPKDTIYDPMGQWKYPGQITKIPSGNITMQGVPYPVYGVDNLGYAQMMHPGQEYSYPGNLVTEYPLSQAKTGGWLDSLPKAQVGRYIPSWLNPYNWGVTDYTDKKDFNKAYSSARNAGEKEYLYKGKRYSTNYAGTPEQQLKETGILDQQLGVNPILRNTLYKNITPYTSVLPPVVQGIKGLFSQDENRDINVQNSFPITYQSTKIPFRDLPEEEKQKYKQQSQEHFKRAEDAWALYTGNKQKFNTFEVSKHKPSRSNDANAVYLSVNKSYPQVLDFILKEGKNLKTGESKFIQEPENLLFRNFKIAKGKDERGEYLSYYDKWNLNPSLEFPVPEQGKPFEIYDRIYLDSKTGKPKNKKAYGGDPSLPNITGHYPFGGQNTKTHTHMSKGGWLDKYQIAGSVNTIPDLSKPFLDRQFVQNAIKTNTQAKPQVAQRDATSVNQKPLMQLSEYDKTHPEYREGLLGAKDFFDKELLPVIGFGLESAMPGEVPFKPFINSSVKNPINLELFGFGIKNPMASETALSQLEREVLAAQEDLARANQDAITFSQSPANKAKLQEFRPGQDFSVSNQHARFIDDPEATRLYDLYKLENDPNLSIEQYLGKARGTYGARNYGDMNDVVLVNKNAQSSTLIPSKQAYTDAMHELTHSRSIRLGATDAEKKIASEAWSPMLKKNSFGMPEEEAFAVQNELRADKLKDIKGDRVYTEKDIPEIKKGLQEMINEGHDYLIGTNVEDFNFPALIKSLNKIGLGAATLGLGAKATLKEKKNGGGLNKYQRGGTYADSLALYNLSREQMRAAQKDPNFVSGTVETRNLYAPGTDVLNNSDYVLAVPNNRSIYTYSPSVSPNTYTPYYHPYIMPSSQYIYDLHDRAYGLHSMPLYKKPVGSRPAPKKTPIVKSPNLEKMPVLPVRTSIEEPQVKPAVLPEAQMYMDMRGVWSPTPATMGSTGKTYQRSRKQGGWLTKYE